jgi:NTE family protein
MRASMSVPGVFSPVKIGDDLLVDGGLVRNLPVDIVRQMGADIVIAVDVGKYIGKLENSHQSLFKIAGQIFTLMTRSNVLEQLPHADLIIAPMIEGMTASDFHLGAKFIEKGEEIVRDLEKEVKQYSVNSEEFQKYLTKQRETEKSVPEISSISVSGNERVNTRIILERVHSMRGDTLNLDTIQEDISRIHGLGEFKTVTFNLIKSGENVNLEFVVREKPWGPNYLRFGYQLTSDLEGRSNYKFLFNFTKMSINRLGAEWSTDFVLGEGGSLFSEFYQPLDYATRFFIAPQVFYKQELIDIYDKQERIAEYNLENLGFACDFGYNWDRYGEFRIGIAFNDLDFDVSIGDPTLPQGDVAVNAIEAIIHLDRLDHSFFPRDGFEFLVSSKFSLDSLGSSDSYEKAGFLYSHYNSRGKHTFMTRFGGGSSFNSDLPAYDYFNLGGLQRITALAEGELRGKYIANALVGYFYQLKQFPPSLGSGLYIGGWLETGNAWESVSQITFDSLLYGAAGGVGMDTILGTLYFVYGQAEGGRGHFHFLLGNQF